jgi:hypothetical protein
MRESVRVSEHTWFVAWMVVGCALALGAISFALGPLVLIPAAVIAVLMIPLGLVFVLGGFAAYRLRRH